MKFNCWRRSRRGGARLWVRAAAFLLLLFPARAWPWGCDGHQAVAIIAEKHMTAHALGCLDRLRSKRWQFWRKRPDAADEETILAMAASTSPDAEDQAFARQVGQRLARGLEGLSGRQRAVFTLRHYEDHSLEEIAQILDLDVGTVKAHLSRALVKLREELKDLYGMSKQALEKRRK